MNTNFPDVSKWQGEVNFDVMKSKTDYVILKIGQGNHTDPQFNRNKSECQRVGLNWGIYWFFDDRFSPATQANALVIFLEGSKPAEIWCDWESTYNGQYQGLNNVVAFMERVETLTSQTVGMYTGYYWFMENSNPINNASHYKYLKDKPLWEAWYTPDHTDNGIEKVKIPPVWGKMDVWQYGTPAIGYEYGAKSIEIDMNKRITAPQESKSRKIVANYNNKLVEYKEV